jgi:cardiolipin synthase
MTITQIGIIVIHLVIAPLAAGHALLYKRDPRAALGWVGMCILFPVFGPFLYFLFGINRVHSRAGYLHKKGESRRLFGFERSEGTHPVSPMDCIITVAPELQSLKNLSDSLVDFSLVENNNVRLLENGEGAYPLMLDAINKAQKSVYLMSYIIETNKTGKLFIEALKNAKNRGVDVRVIIDGLGELYSFPRISRRLKKQDIEVARFLPPAIWPPVLHINLRNHRKLLIADDQIAFAGGMNIGDRHLVKDPKNKNPTQDIHFEFHGPIVEQLHSLFADTWYFTAKKPLPNFSAILRANGNASCRVIADGPDKNLDKLELIMIGAISIAKHTIRIMTPYFLPSREMISALKTASMKGVNVFIVLPVKCNLPYVQWATHNMIGELLAFGVHISKQAEPFSHAKLLLIDHHYAMLGSANIDPRSLRLNFEIGIEVYDENSVENLIAYFTQAEKNAEPYQLSEIDGRSLPIRLRDSICWLFSPYL